MICNACGETFTKEHGNQIFCKQAECQNRRKRESSRRDGAVPLGTVLPCKRCGEDFTKGSSGQIYCKSTECKRGRARENAHTETTIPLGTVMNCELCDSPFVKTATTQRFCRDDECSRMRAQIRWERWREKEESRRKRLEYQRNYRSRTDIQRMWEVKNKYGLEWDDYLALLERANERCEVCGAKSPLCVDHDHNTGVVRGLLCRNCNAGIGQLGDSIAGVKAALDYLSRGLRSG